ncbi:MAG: CRTAC1 family protein [Planctomycetaceae bacterium]
MNSQIPHDPLVDDTDPETQERDDAVIGTALRASLIVLALLATCGGGTIWWLTRPAPPAPEQKTQLAKVEVRESPQLPLPSIRFTDITEEAGIAFIHENGAAGEKLLPETMGSGCAFLDYDGDGDQDLLLVNSRRWPWDSRASQDRPATMALYRNDGTGVFTDVTQQSGLDVSLYGVGVAVGDYDSDGRVDVFISAIGSNSLFHNEGEGKFRDVTDEAGVSGSASEWSTSCGWFDFDRDGDLDLMVCNYLVWSREFDSGQNFQLTGGSRAYGRPQNFEGCFPYLYRNDGGGRFAEISDEAGLQVRTPTTGEPMAKSLGLTFADFDNDGWLDVIVANDTVQNFLFRNRQDGSFQEMGGPAGIAFDMAGNARGAMGIDVSAFRNDGCLGVAIGNFSNEMTALYVTQPGQLMFVDEAISTGLGPNTRLQLTFGVFYFDADLDGRVDIFAANGHLEDEINRVQPSQHYEQAPQLFWNCGPKQATEFRPLSIAETGAEFAEPLVGRGASYADIDGDGDLDILITAVAQRPRLLRNDQDSGHHWLRVKLHGTVSNPDAIGSWVSVTLPDRVLRQQVMPTRSYASQVELPLTFGLGDDHQIEKLTIEWADGLKQEVATPRVDQLIDIDQPLATPVS